MSFDLDAGEFVVISGPSGSGKTTLLHLLAALDRPDAGTIRVDGRDIVHLHQLTGYRRHEIGLVFQLHNLIPRLTAAQNVAIAMFGTGLGHRDRARRAAELLAMVGLGYRVGSKPPTMSGGERQRVAVARALANEPRPAAQRPCRSVAAPRRWAHRFDRYALIGTLEAFGPFVGG